MTMERWTTTLPDSLTELALLRLGLQARGFAARRFARRLLAQVDAEARRPAAREAGLLSSESFTIGRGHYGVLQYWRGFDELEAWARRPPHSEWWRVAVERMRTKGDLGVYHELFLVRRGDLEAISMDCRPAGVSSFGVRGEPVGAMTTSRGRLGRSGA